MSGDYRMTFFFFIDEIMNDSCTDYAWAKGNNRKSLSMFSRSMTLRETEPALVLSLQLISEVC